MSLYYLIIIRALCREPSFSFFNVITTRKLIYSFFYYIFAIAYDSVRVLLTRQTCYYSILVFKRLIRCVKVVSISQSCFVICFNFLLTEFILYVMIKYQKQYLIYFEIINISLNVVPGSIIIFFVPIRIILII